MQSNRATRRPQVSLRVATVTFLAVPVLAAINVLVGPYAVIPYVAIAAAVAMFIVPLGLLLYVCLASAAVLAGLIDYFGHVPQGFWLPYLMGALFALRGLSERLGLASQAGAVVANGLGRLGNGPRPWAWLAVTYVLIVAFGLCIALPPLPQVIVALKNYFFMWGVLLVLLWSPWRVGASDRFWTAVVVVACLQWPLVLYQRFVVAARRHDAASWDAIVGTFGGDPQGGGNSAAMAFVCCLAVGVIATRLRQRRMGKVTAGVMILMSLAPIALAEVKAAFIWLAVVFLVLFGSKISREPLRAGLALLTGLSLVVGLGAIYKISYESQRGGRSSTLQELYERQIKYAIDPSEYRAEYQRLGRIASLVYWWQRHDLRSDPVGTLVGHGLGASRSVSSLGVGEIARRLRISVDRTSASTMLWDVGLLGALAFAGLIATSALSGIRLSLKPQLPSAWRESAALAAAALSMAGLGLLYNNDPIDNPTVQLLVYFSIAQVVLARRAMDAVVNPRQRFLGTLRVAGGTRV